MSITLRAEFYFDDEVNTWHYRVPALHINGGGTTPSASVWTRSSLPWRATQASSTATPRRSPSRSSVAPAA